MVKVAVVILNWNGKHFLQKFLPSVVKYSTQGLAEVWVADNGSEDGSVEFLKAEFPTVKILEFSKNYGFTGGYNRALAEIEAEYYVLLNSDVEVTKEWIEPVISYMDTDSNVVAAMPKLLTYDDKNRFEYAGAAGGYIDKYGFPFCKGRMLSVTEVDTGQYNEISDVFWATGACMFIRANVYREMGGLDEDFFAHMEEIDLCWRLKNRGHRIVYIPQSVVYHVGGGTLPNNNPHKLFLNYRNNLYLLYKNLPSGQLWWVILVRMFIDGASAMAYLLQGKIGFFKAVPSAHFAFYTSLKKFRQKRENLKKSVVVTNHKEMYKKSLLISFFIEKRKTFSELSKKGWR